MQSGRRVICREQGRSRVDVVFRNRQDDTEVKSAACIIIVLLI
jgi:hypothetical protein